MEGWGKAAVLTPLALQMLALQMEGWGSPDEYTCTGKAAVLTPLALQMEEYTGKAAVCV